MVHKRGVERWLLLASLLVSAVGALGTAAGLHLRVLPLERAGFSLRLGWPNYLFYTSPYLGMTFVALVFRSRLGVALIVLAAGLVSTYAGIYFWYDEPWDPESVLISAIIPLSQWLACVVLLLGGWIWTTISRARRAADPRAGRELVILAVVLGVLAFLIPLGWGLMFAQELAFLDLSARAALTVALGVLTVRRVAGIRWGLLTLLGLSCLEQLYWTGRGSLLDGARVLTVVFLAAATVVLLLKPVSRYGRQTA